MSKTKIFLQNLKSKGFKISLLSLFLLSYSYLGFSQTYTYPIKIKDANIGGNFPGIIFNSGYSSTPDYYYMNNYNTSGTLTLGGMDIWFYNMDSKGTNSNHTPVAYYNTSKQIQLIVSFNLQGNIVVGNSATISCDIYSYSGYVGSVSFLVKIVPCNDFIITGPSSVCSSGATFTVNGATSYVTWTFSSNLKSYYGGNNFVALNLNGTGTGWIQAVVPPTEAGCTTSTLTKTVAVGVPATPALSFQPNGSCDYYALTTAMGDVTYYWSENGSSWIQSSDYTYYGDFVAFPRSPRTINVYLKEVDGCGTSPVKSISKNLAPCGAK
jgi:hypothetical protein